jgi:predicted nucleotidyltransferase
MDHLPSITALERTRDTLEVLFGRRVDVVEREAVEASRNPIRRRRILANAHPPYAA